MAVAKVKESVECFVAELVPGGNAEASGQVKVGDVLRITTAVAKTSDKVSVGRFQVEPSLDQRKQVGACNVLEMRIMVLA